MIERALKNVLLEDAATFPAVTLFGPRQSGKTTLVRSCFPDYEYVNLEDPEERDLARNDYKAFFRRHGRRIVIDEVQRVPEITSAIQVIIDEHRDEPGQFILTGSHQTRLYNAVSQSLAGRTGVLNLMPPDLAELKTEAAGLSADEIIYRGFMPELWTKRISPSRYYRNYFMTYAERDLRQLANIRDLSAFEQFVRLLAGRVGQVVNLSAMSNDTGVSSTTLAQWLSILEASFLVFRLAPDGINRSRRLVKSPKVYFVDTGLAAYLLGISTPDQVARDPLRGNLFENMVVADVYKRKHHVCENATLGFIRTENGFEIDLTIRSGRVVRPVEIKSGATWNDKFASALRKYTAEKPDSLQPTVVYDGDDADFSSGVMARNFRNSFFL